MKLSEHRNVLLGVEPPREYLLRYVVPDPRGSPHWFWCDRRANHGHDSRGLAFVRWRVKPTAKTHGKSRGDYYVARLLFGPVESGVVVRNRCGLSECVNPDHWARAVPAAKHRIVVGPAAWDLVRLPSERRCAAPVVVRIAGLDHVVHVARAAPPAPLVTICGTVFDPATTVVLEAPVTCTGGC